MPFLLYLIGTSGSGKTTIGNKLDKYFKEHNNFGKVQFIDGDVLRKKFGGIFGYTKEERFKSGKVCNVVFDYLLQNDVSVIVAQVAPYEEWRAVMREQFGASYIQCYVKCSYEECCRRDPKGYYKKAASGKMDNLNGANDVYETPLNSEIIVDTEKESLDSCCNKIINYISDFKNKTK